MASGHWVGYHEDASMSEGPSATTWLLFREWVEFKETKVIHLTLMQSSSELNVTNIQQRTKILIFLG